MGTKAIFQTLEDRDNPDEIEMHGPFLCDRSKAWVGTGYYFWESFIENAHWWGDQCNTYTNGYVICQAKYDFDEDKCFNLIDNSDHINKLIQAIDILKQNNVIQDSSTVSRVIEHMKSTLNIFKFEACRVNGMNSRSKQSQFSKFLYFAHTKNAYLDLRPTIQICFYSKNSLNLRNYKIIYPDKYIDGDGDVV